jgi:hypothetical protein
LADASSNAEILGTNRFSYEVQTQVALMQIGRNDSAIVKRQKQLLDDAYQHRKAGFYYYLMESCILMILCYPLGTKRS